MKIVGKNKRNNWMKIKVRQDRPVDFSVFLFNRLSYVIKKHKQRHEYFLSKKDLRDFKQRMRIKEFQYINLLNKRKRERAALNLKNIQK